MKTETVTRSHDDDRIDPFGFYPDAASRIAGLGGTANAPYEAYVFRSAGVTLQPGKTRFTLHFDKLKAGSQIILIEILNRTLHPGNTWARLRIEGVHLQEIVERNGQWHVEIDAYPDIAYAVAGYLHDVGDVSADKLELSVDRRARIMLEDEPVSSNEQRGVEGATVITGRQRISGPDVPNFVNPSSQPWTPDQGKSPAFLACRAALTGEQSVPRDPWDWPKPFIINALERYRAIAPGGAALAVGIDDVDLPAAIVRRGCTVTLIDLPAEAGACIDLGKAIQDILAQRADDRDRLSSAIGMDMLYPVSTPAEFQKRFDCGWWIADRETPYATVAATLGIMLAGLKSNGTAVLILPFHSRREAGALTRQDVERLALDAISNGHSIAQLRFASSDLPSGTDPIPYALIVRRGA